MNMRRPSNVRFHMRLVISVPLVASCPASSVSLSASAYRITASWNAPTKLFTCKQTCHVTGYLPWRHCASPRYATFRRTKNKSCCSLRVAFVMFACVGMSYSEVFELDQTNYDWSSALLWRFCCDFGTFYKRLDLLTYAIVTTTPILLRSIDLIHAPVSKISLSW